MKQFTKSAKILGVFVFAALLNACSSSDTTSNESAQTRELTSGSDQVFPLNYLDQGTELMVDIQGDAKGVQFVCVFSQFNNPNFPAATDCTKLPGTPMATFNKTSGVLSWTPNAFAHGRYEITITAWKGKTLVRGKHKLRIRGHKRAQQITQIAEEKFFVDVRALYEMQNLTANYDADFVSFMGATQSPNSIWPDLSVNAFNADLSAQYGWMGNGTTQNPNGFVFDGSSHLSVPQTVITNNKTTVNAWILSNSANNPGVSIMGNRDGSSHGFTVRQADETGKLQLLYGHSNYKQAVLGDSPIAYWRLGETSGSLAQDSSGNGHDAQYSSSVTLGAPGKFDSTAAQLDGMSGYVESNDTTLYPGSGEWSVEAWFQTNQTDGYHKLLAWYSSGTPLVGNDSVYGMEMSPNGQIVWSVRDKFGAWVGVQTPGSYNDSNWHHIVGTFSRTNVSLYMDGQAVASTSHSLQAIEAGGTHVQIGRTVAEWTPQGAGFLNGTIQEVALYRSALSAQQVRYHYSFKPGTCISTRSLTPNSWALVTAVVSNSGGSLYLNGQMECQFTSGGSIPIASSQPFMVGTDTSGNYGWKGGLSDLKFYQGNFSVDDAPAILNFYQATAVKFPAY